MRTSLPAVAKIAAALVLCGFASVRPALADTIAETEPNDYLATANQLLGFGNELVALGESNYLSDVDTFSFLVTAPGGVRIDALGSAFGGGLTLPNPVLFALAPGGPTGQGTIIAFDLGEIGGNARLNLTLEPGLYYAAAASGTSALGSYRLEVRGVGGVVEGTAIPESGTGALLAGGLLPLAGAAVRRPRRA